MGSSNPFCPFSRLLSLLPTPHIFPVDQPCHFNCRLHCRHSLSLHSAELLQQKPSILITNECERCTLQLFTADAAERDISRPRFWLSFSPDEALGWCSPPLALRPPHCGAGPRCCMTQSRSLTVAVSRPATGLSRRGWRPRTTISAEGEDRPTPDVQMVFSNGDRHRAARAPQLVHIYNTYYIGFADCTPFEKASFPS